MTTTAKPTLKRTSLDSWLRQLGLTRFDITVILTVLLLLGAIAGTLLFGVEDFGGVQVAYMQEPDRAAGESGTGEIYLVSMETGNTRQLTDSAGIILDFDVSGDGDSIVYSERDTDTGRADLYLISLLTGETRQLTNCIMQDSDCLAPEFRPDGQMIAYERIDYNSELGLGVSPNRIWLLDLEANATAPLFEDSQILGNTAVWADNGRRLAMYDNNSRGIVIYNFDANTDNEDELVGFIPSDMGLVGEFSPDGTRMIYPEIVIEDGGARSYLQLADFTTGFLSNVTDPGELADDQFTDWSPDGRYIAIGRRYDTQATQVYLYDTQAGGIEPLGDIFDPKYNHSPFQWNASSDRLVIQRFQMFDESGGFYNNGQLEIWAYDLNTGQMQKLVENARNPQWVPAVD
jgi:Tol biopolymer transport system component